MNILLLDVYPDVDYRISKDQNGGYGTANDYGKTLFTSEKAKNNNNNNNIELRFGCYS